MSARVRQITFASHDHVLTNVNVFTPDSAWIVYDIRSSQGATFDGKRIERVHVHTGEVETLFTGRHGAHCGVVTCSPVRDEVVFIYGPEHATPDFTYGPARRQGVLVDVATRAIRNLDARDLTPPFTPGALRGGTHVHVFSPDGTLVSSTYDDLVLEARVGRTIAVSVLNRPVRVPRSHPRNHDGDAFSVVVACPTNDPRPGSDDFSRACEEGWIGSDGYLRADGTRQRRALAFQGQVTCADGRPIAEVFVVDLPDDLTTADERHLAGERPLAGDEHAPPAPPRGCVTRRLTFTAGRRFPGLCAPRHWLRSSPDGSRIAFLMNDDSGVAQLWTISPNGGEPTQVTRNALPIASAFTWSACGRFIAHAMDGSVCRTDVERGETVRLTDRTAFSPRAEACVYSPDGSLIAFVAPVRSGEKAFDQIHAVGLE